MREKTEFKGIILEEYMNKLLGYILYTYSPEDFIALISPVLNGKISLNEKESFRRGVEMYDLIVPDEENDVLIFMHPSLAKAIEEKELLGKNSADDSSANEKKAGKKSADKDSPDENSPQEISRNENNVSVLDFKEWEEKNKPILDHDTDWNEINQNPLHIWTECSGDEGSYILSGLHYVNRIGYYITEIPFEEEDEIFVFMNDVDTDESSVGGDI